MSPGGHRAGRFEGVARADQASGQAGEDVGGAGERFGSRTHGIGSQSEDQVIAGRPRPREVAEAARQRGEGLARVERVVGRERRQPVGEIEDGRVGDESHELVPAADALVEGGSTNTDPTGDRRHRQPGKTGDFEELPGRRDDLVDARAVGRGHGRSPLLGGSLQHSYCT